MPDLLTPAERAAYLALAEVMLPGAGELPSAADAGLDGEPLDRVVGVRPDLLEPLRALLAAVAGDDPASAVAAAMADPVRGGVLSVAVYGAYYLTPAARGAIGYAGHGAHAIRRDENDGLEALLAPVAARGPIYRAAA